MSRANVLYLIRTWAIGGSHTILFSLLERLPKDRFNIVTVPYDSHSGGDDAFVEAARARNLPVAEDRIPWKSRTAWFRARAKVGELIEKHGIDVVHTHDPHSNVLVGVGRRRWPCACVASAYGWWNRTFPLRSHAYIWLERNVALPRFDRVITVSDHMQRRVLQGPTSPSRVRVIHTGLDVSAMKSGPARIEARAAVRAELRIPMDAVVVGTVGRVYIEKGHSYLLQAIERLLPSYPSARALIVGEGPLRPRLEQEAKRLGIANNVTFLGYYDDLPAVLAAMDVFTLPSVLEEGFPTAVLEAQAAGLPIVASDVGGTRETIKEGSTGLLVPPKDPAAVSDALAKLIGDDGTRARMGQVARRWIEGSFSVQAMIDQVCTTYQQALDEYRRSG